MSLFTRTAALMILSVLSQPSPSHASGYCRIEFKDLEYVQKTMKFAGKSQKLKNLLERKKMVESAKPDYSLSFKKLAWTNKAGKTVGTGYQFKIRDLDTGRIVSESNAYLRLVRDQYTIKDKLLKESAARKMYWAMRGLKSCTGLTKVKERKE